MTEDSQAYVMHLKDKEKMHAFLEKLITHAQRSLWFNTHALCPELLNHASICTLLAAFVRQSKRNEVRFLTCHSDIIEQRGHHVVTLAQKLPSFIKIRKIPREFQEAYASKLMFMGALCDHNHALIIQNHINQETALALWEKKAKVAALIRDNELLWERSEEIIGFRRLGI